MRKSSRLCRMQIAYTGWSQGVGLRFMIPEIAGRFRLAGWVTNTPDGRVEIMAQGERPDVEAFIAFLDEKYDFWINPKDKELKKLRVKKNLTGFQIKL